MHVAIDIRSLLDPQQTGVGQFTSGVVRALLADGSEHQCSFYYNAAKSVDVPSYIPRDSIIRTRFPNKLMTMCSPVLNRPYVDDIVTKQKGTVDLFFSPNIQYLPLHSSPRIVTVHDLSFLHFPEYFSHKGRTWHQLQRVAKQLKDATAIVVPSESTRDDVVYSFGIAAEKIHVVSPGINASYARQISTQETQSVIKKYQLPDRFLFFLGTIEPRKNLVTLIEAYERSGLFRKGVALILAGAKGWNDNAIHAAIAQTEGVRYIGYVKEVEKAPLYHLAEAFVYPSLYEGFGFPVLEAMAQGTPVITSNRTSLVEITNGQATYVHPHRVDELTGALKECVENKKDTTEVKKYSWEQTANQLLEIFERYVK